LGVSDFKNLKVWRKAHALALNVHRVIPANIFEGSGQEGAKQYARFVRFSVNSTTELEYHLIAVRDLRLIKSTDFKSLSEQTVEVRKMLYGLLRHLDRSSVDPAAPKSRA